MLRGKSIQSQITDINNKLIEIDKAFNELLRALLFEGEDVPDIVLIEVRDYAEYLMWKKKRHGVGTHAA